MAKTLSKVAIHWQIFATLGILLSFQTACVEEDHTRTPILAKTAKSSAEQTVKDSEMIDLFMKMKGRAPNPSELAKLKELTGKNLSDKEKFEQISAIAAGQSPSFQNDLENVSNLKDLIRLFLTTNHKNPTDEQTINEIEAMLASGLSWDEILQKINLPTASPLPSESPKTSPSPTKVGTSPSVSPSGSPKASPVVTVTPKAPPVVTVSPVSSPVVTVSPKPSTSPAPSGKTFYCAFEQAQNAPYTDSSPRYRRWFVKLTNTSWQAAEALALRYCYRSGGARSGNLGGLGCSEDPSVSSSADPALFSRITLSRRLLDPKLTGITVEENVCYETLCQVLYRDGLAPTSFNRTCLL